MLWIKLLYIFLVSALIAVTIYLQPSYTGFFTYTVGSNSRLEAFDSADSQGGGVNAFINEPVTFFANFTDLTSGNPINGSNVSCEIKFNISGNWSAPQNMTYNGSSTLYEYNRTLNLMGNYTFNVLCDGSTQGQDILNVSDDIMVYRYEWWNHSWNYRLRIEVETGDYNVSNWPVERYVNFTDALRQAGSGGLTFDENSTRIFEHNLTGSVMHEVGSQLDKGQGYNESENAVGTAVFIMNGTTENNNKRVFYLYFDVLENGAKAYPNYTTNLSYAWSGDEILFNNTKLNFFLDTNRSENTSGLYQVYYPGASPPQVFYNEFEENRTVEYLEYSNGTHNFSFDLRENVTIISGPVRLTIIQTGDEIIWGNTSLVTGEGKMVKKYYIYNRAGPEETGTFILIEQNFTNYAGYSVDRNSTEAGALAFDVVKSWNSYGVSLSAFDGNNTDPNSWFYANSNFGDIVGLVNINETTPGFFATNDSVGMRIGIQLGNTTINSGVSIMEKAVTYFGKGGAAATDEFLAIKNAFTSPPLITEGDSEQRTSISYTQTDYDVYNRNETIFIYVNVTYDPYSLVKYVNVTIDNGTAGPGDDINLTMYDDGTNGDGQANDSVFTNYYNISNYENLGVWNATALLFDENLLLLNQSKNNFTITKTLFVNTTIINPQGLVNRIVNATVDVMNYRQDIWHPNVTLLNCTYDSSEVDQDNIMDLNNGTYYLNFTAPPQYGLYVLNCSTYKNGNDGYGTDEFTTEALETNLSIVVVPDNFTAENVTWLQNQSFLITVNATNTANSSAYNTSINLELPQNLTSNSSSDWCGNILISKSCIRSFNITVLKTTAPANFTVNISVTWNNSNQVPDQNETFLNVTVLPTYILDVLEENITSTVAAGVKKNIENITVRSFGNAELVNVTFNVTGFDGSFNFTFQPTDFDTLAPGNTTQVQIYLEVPQWYSSGDYSGILNVTSDNDGYEELIMNVTVSGTNMTLSVSPANFTAENITYYVAQNFTLDFNATNIGNATAFDVNITLNFSTPYIFTSNSTPYECGDKAKSEYCSGSLIITVSNGTLSGNYTINVSVVWDNPEIGIMSNSSLVNITVFSNVILTIPEDDVIGNITHGTTGILGNFTMNSSGNDPVEGAEFIIVDIANQLQDFNITVIPNITETGGNLSGGIILVVNVSVEVPLGYPPGLYGGFLNVTTTNAGYKNISLEITIPASRTWLVEDPTSLYCEHPESPPFNIVCNVTMNNTGNVNITFNITPPTSPTGMYNYTWTEVVNFSVENQTTFQFSVFYNVSGVGFDFYSANYTISGVQASPSSQNLSILLTPFVSPIIQINITPANIQQQGNVKISAMVNDQSGVTDINFTILNITRPDNVTDSIMMRFVQRIGNDWYYEEYYPDDPFNGTWGSTLLRGNYSVSVYSENTLGLNSTENASFFAYVRLLVTCNTTRSNGIYYQGEKGTLTYKVTDAAGFGTGNVNVSISITDPNNRSVNVDQGEFLTNSQGEPPAYPNFELFADSPPGNYNITSVSVYNDTAVDIIVTNITISNFTVLESVPGMLLLDLEAPATSSIDDDLEVYATVTDGVSNVDADSAVASLYDSLDNAILTDQPMTYVSTGRYTMWYNTSASSNQGNWRWVVTITKDGNVITKDIFTRLVGGPFDVRDITVIDNTVPGLEISVVVENTGDAYQDVTLEWNLTRTDTGGSLDSGADTFRVDGNSDRTHTVDPSTDYIGEVRITFLAYYSGTERAGAYDIFNTTKAPSKPPPGPPGGPEGPTPGAPQIGPMGPPPQPGIEIVDYPKEIATEVGWAQYPSVTVNNTGNVMLRNIVLRIDGVPQDWYTVEPRLLPVMNIGGSKTFVVNLLVPEGTEAKQYYGTLNVTTNETYDEKMISVIVFGSREELVRYQLRKLKEKFEEFKEDVNATAEEGKLDLTRVYNMINEIQHQIDLTEGYLDAKMFDEALDSVTTGWRLLDRGRELLRTAPPLKPVTVLVIPDWLITLLLILIILILVLVVIISKYKKRLTRIFRRQAPEIAYAKETIAPGPAVSPAVEEIDTAREEEKEKIRKVLNLLEREYKEGIISEKAYNELRKRNLKKLKELGGAV